MTREELAATQADTSYVDVPVQGAGFLDETEPRTITELNIRLLGGKALLSSFWYLETSGATSRPVTLPREAARADESDLNLLRVYLDQAASYPRLSAAQEIDLGERMGIGTMAKAVLEIRNGNVDEVGQALMARYAPDVAAEVNEAEADALKKAAEARAERDLEALQSVAAAAHTDDALRLLVQDGEQAKEILVTSNLLLVVSLVRRYVGLGLDYLDLIQEGNEALTKVAERFDYTRGLRFSTAAYQPITGAARRAIAQYARSLRLPVQWVNDIGRVSRKERELEQELGRNATDSELAAASGISEERLNELRTAEYNQPVSLDEPMWNEEGGEDNLPPRSDFVEDVSSLSPEKVMQQRSLSDLARQALRGLNNEKWESVVRDRHGINAEGIEYTLEQIANRQSRHHEVVRWRYIQAMARLQTLPEMKALLEYLGP